MFRAQKLEPSCGNMYEATVTDGASGSDKKFPVANSFYLKPLALEKHLKWLTVSMIDHHWAMGFTEVSFLFILRS
jgi:hypothetical protein